MKYIKLKDNIIRRKNILSVTKHDDAMYKEYNIFIALDNLDKLIKAVYDTGQERDIDYNKILRCLRLKMDKIAPKSAQNGAKTV